MSRAEDVAAGSGTPGAAAPDGDVAAGSAVGDAATDGTAAGPQASLRRALPQLLVLALAMFVVGTNAFVIAGVLPEIAQSLATTSSTVGLAITGYAIAVALGAPAVSILLTRVPRAPLMAVGLALFAGGSAIATAATGMPLFVLGRVVSGLGGAALVPTATAAAASLVPASQRGRALALVGAGFTLAVAVGSPLGTAVGGLLGWRAPLWCIVALGAVLAVVIPFTVRHVALPPPTALRRRFAPLTSGRTLLTLGAALLTVSAFNIVYIYSATVMRSTTGGSGTLLAALLLAYGAAGVVGTVVVGPLTDRIGSRVTAAVALAGQLVALAVLPLVLGSFTAAMIVFAVWGGTVFAAAIPIQHRLVAIHPEQAAQALSWYSTAMYLGIAAAPPLGALALATGGPSAVPVIASIVTAGAIVLFLLGYAGLRAAEGPHPRRGARAVPDRATPRP